MNTTSYTKILAIPLLAGIVAAEGPKAQALLMALGANGKQMVSYQWKQKTTIIRKGNAAGFRIDEVRFDAGGQPQRITIAQPEQKRMGPLRAKKAAEIKDSVEEAMQLAGRYANPRQIGQAIQKSEIWEKHGTLRVEARSLILPGDEMTMVVNGATYLATRIDIKTRYDGSPVAIGIDYQQLPNGPSMMTRMTVQIPGEGIAVNVESYDFVRLRTPVGF